MRGRNLWIVKYFGEVDKGREHLILTALALLLFLPGLGQVHLFDWDEINFAESAREMLLTGEWWKVQIHFEAFWEKPPLFIWLQALSMKLFGVGEFAARFPNAIAGALTLNVMWWMAKRESGVKTAVWWTALYLGSLAPHFYFKSGIIDPWFNLFIFLAFYQIYLSRKHSFPIRSAVYTGIFLGLAVLTKGPVALLIIIMSVFVWVIVKRDMFFGWKETLLAAFACLLVVGIWLIPEILRSGWSYLRAFLDYQADLFLNPVASHGQPFYYHFVVLLLLCFPASVLALAIPKRNRSGDLNSWMQVLFWTVLCLFSLVTTKIVHYSSLCYLPLTFMAARRIAMTPNPELVLPNWGRYLFIGVGSVLALVFMSIPVLGYKAPAFSTQLESIIRDPFALANLSVTDVWRGWEWSISSVFIAAIAVAALALKRSNPKLLLVSMIFFISFISIFIRVVVPGVERHTQGGIIHFFKKKAGDDCSFYPFGYKTYAHYFYGNIQAPESQDPLLQKKDSIFKMYGAGGTIDLDHLQKLHLDQVVRKYYLENPQPNRVFIICKPNKKGELERMPELTLFGEYGGYYVFERKEDGT